nr:hypothetical protein [Kibdelosporangium sp. MJ126-NF4]CTQ92682.1 hypothetical protein [Kibdelosporangium sp. MJ126-NF4]
MRTIKILLTVAALAFAMGAIPGTASADVSPLTTTSTPPASLHDVS